LITIGATDTKLPYDVGVAWGKDVAKVKKVRSPADRPLPPQVRYPNYPVTVHVGDLSWGFEDVDEAKLPHCNVGGWETSRGILDIAPVGTFSAM
jgi:hypothetical protein